MSRRPRDTSFLRNMIISFTILSVIFLCGGIAYTWYIGQNNVEASAVIEPVLLSKPRTTTPVKHVQSANARVSASVQSMTSSVAPGSQASITVRTNPDAQCTISVVYDKTASTDPGLASKIADEYGMITWTWMVEPSVPIGKWPVKVTCVMGANSGVVGGNLLVTTESGTGEDK